LYKESLLKWQTADEWSATPVLSTRDHELPHVTVLQAFEADKLLHFPRISSLHHFHELCPSWSESASLMSGGKASRYCFIVLASSRDQTPRALFDQPYRAELVQRLQSDEFVNAHARLTYLYHDVQSDFAAKLHLNSKSKKSQAAFFQNKIIVLKRLDDKYSQYEWLADVNFDTLNTPVKLIQLVKTALLGYTSTALSDQPLRFKLRIPVFYEETKRDLLYYLFYAAGKVYNVVHFVTTEMDLEQVFNDHYYLILLVTTTLCVCLTLKFFSYNAHMAAQAADEAAAEHRRLQEEAELAAEAAAAQYEQAARHEPVAASSCQTVQIYEMTSQTYDRLVTKLPRGYRTILLVVKDGDNELVDSFARVCQSYCK
jgi:hypothetical protein